MIVPVMNWFIVFLFASITFNSVYAGSSKREVTQVIGPDSLCGCTCSDYKYKGYGNCEKDYNEGKMCYVHLPTTCPDALDSNFVPGKKISWKACTNYCGRNKIEENAVGVGGWGGLCQCPDGQQYFVGDNNGSGCKTLACVGGIKKSCHKKVDSKWKHRKVTCIAPYVPYKPGFMYVKMTCKSPLLTLQDISKPDCEIKCNEISDCEFIFYNTNYENCMLFQNCEEPEIGIQNGNTYAKTKCPDQWIQTEVGQYKVVEEIEKNLLCASNDKCTWTESRDICRNQEKGYLVKISTNKENSRIFEVLRELRMIKSDFNFFIGLQKIGNDLIWSAGSLDNRTAGYKNFQTGDDAINCVIMKGDESLDGKWGGVQCSKLNKGSNEKFFPICEKDINSGLFGKKVTVWQKQDKYFCRICNRPFDTMVEAIEGLRNIQDRVIYDMFCDGIGLFCACPYEDIIKQTHPKGIDCLYKRVGSRRKRKGIKEEL